jgi:predicted dehydrogenase
MTERIRVGIVGVGWGALVHAPAFRLVPEFELVALCGRRQEPLARAATQLGIGDTSTNWMTFVRRDDLDLISIATPVSLHYPIFMAAIAAGKHVLCEKPLALTSAQCREMAEAAESSGRATAVCFELRWTPERYAIWAAINRGTIGEPYLVHVTRTVGYWHPSHRLQSLWMYRLDDGGGYLNGMASHEIDFIHTLFGDTVAVCADVRSSIPRRLLPDGGELVVDADDTSALLLRLSSGALAVITSSAIGVHSDLYLWQACGSRGTITLHQDPAHQRLTVATPADAHPKRLAPSDRSPRSGVELPPRRSSAAIQAMALMLEDWLPAFSGKPTRVPSIRDGWRVQSVIDAARQSSDTGRWVEIQKVT